ncbi:MAG: DUF86 domain-containing protein [Ignavibacterium sp.]|nr:DUF86 domain-containing protein [Ignavibacterium sp.]
MYDKEVVLKHLTALLTDLKNLEKHKSVTENDLKDNLDLLWILERGIYLSIQNIFDVLAHIISGKFERSWESYAEIAVVLYEEKLINSERRDLLVRMAGFRNRLSHDYLGLDLNIIVDIVNNRLEDLYSFARLISDFTES